MSIELNPSALGLHFVPNGAVIPAGTAYAWSTDTGWRITSEPYDITVRLDDCSRWTVEPLTAPKSVWLSIADRARHVATTADLSDSERIDELACLIEDLADRIEAKQ